MEFPGQGPKSAGGYTISNVSIVDVEAGITNPGRTVTTEGERIKSVIPYSAEAAFEKANLVDGHDLYLIPGLIDAHVHYFDMATFGLMMVAHGVLAVRDMGNMIEQILPMRDALNQGKTLGPEMIAVGSVLDGDPPIIPPISVGC